MRYLFLFILPTIFSVSVVNAEVFKNSYINFSLPSKWKCVSSKTEWICQDNDAGRSREAIIILTAKQVGPKDSLNEYINYLKQPKRVPGAPGPSEIRVQPKRVQISGHVWVDSIHLGSELPNFFTRYLATTKKNLAVLVTLSAHRTAYQKYSVGFSNLINSMRVTSDNTLLTSPQNIPTIGKSSDTGTLGGSMQNVLSDDDLLLDDSAMPQDKSEDNDSSRYILILILGVVGVVAYYVISKKKK